MLEEMYKIIDKSDLSAYDKSEFKERICRTYHSYMLEVDKRKNIEAIDKSSLSTEDKDIFKEFYLMTYKDYVQGISYGRWLPADVYSYQSFEPVSAVLQKLGMDDTNHQVRDKEGYLKWQRYVIFPGKLVRLTAVELAERLNKAQELVDEEKKLKRKL